MACEMAAAISDAHVFQRDAAARYGKAQVRAVARETVQELQAPALQIELHLRRIRERRTEGRVRPAGARLARLRRPEGEAGERGQ